VCAHHDALRINPRNFARFMGEALIAIPKSSSDRQ